MNRHRTASGTDDTDHFASIDHVLFLVDSHHRRCQIAARRCRRRHTPEIVDDRLVVEQEIVADKVHALLERDRVAIARVEDARAQTHVRQQRRAVVDQIDGEQHRLETLYAAFFFYLAARDRRETLVVRW